MRRWHGLIVLGGVILGSAGCAGPATYRYANHILIPPGVKSAAVPERTATLPVSSRCSKTEGGVRIQPRGRSTRVTVQATALLAHPPGWLAGWGLALEKSGCVKPGEGSLLAARIAELIPADPKAVYDLLHANMLTTGYVDLGPEVRLKVLGPILRSGAGPIASAIEPSSSEPPRSSRRSRRANMDVRAAADFLGFETAWFEIKPNASEAGAQIVFLSAEDNTAGKVTRASAPHLDYFKFVDGAAYYRLFYLTRISAADHNIAVMAAPTMSDLEEQTKRFAADPSFCTGANSSMCVFIPDQVAVQPHFIVTVRGSTVAVPISGKLQDALKAAGVTQPETVLPTLTVQRRYAGALVPVTFNRSHPDILDLLLQGGEDIRW
jgi:hypothetical protein